MNASYGLNRSQSTRIFQRAELSKSLVKVQEHKLQYDVVLNSILAQSHVKYDTKLQYIRNIALLDLILCYRGWRHFKGLPLRGQRT